MIVEHIESLAPDWLLRGAGGRWLYTVGAIGDAVIEGAMQAANAVAGRGTPTAIPYIERTRGVPRGRKESQSDYAKRAANWVQIHAERGSMVGLTRALQAYIGAPCIVHVFRRNGVYAKRDENGEYSWLPSAPGWFNWDWSDFNNPYYFGDIWIVIEASDFERPNVAPPTLSVGLKANQAEVSTIRQLVADYTSATARVRAVIFCDEWSWQLNAGDYFRWSKTDSNGVRVESRPSNMRFFHAE